MKLLKDLLLALVNATVLLLIILAVVLLMLVNRTDDIAKDVMAGLAPVGDSLETIATSVDDIEADLQTALTTTESDALAAEVAALRADIAALRAPFAGVNDLTAEGIATAILSRLVPPAAPPAP
jgi:hypothetical protein